MASTTFLKRERESKQRDKARDKEAKRKERQAEKPAREAGADGVDPDIAGIIPGPQPHPYDND